MESLCDLDRRLTAALQGVEAEGVVSAYLFGSHAEARAHRESDVDVGVLLDRRAFPSARTASRRGFASPRASRRPSAPEASTWWCSTTRPRAWVGMS
jgi:hypothetical protein